MWLFLLRVWIFVILGALLFWAAMLADIRELISLDDVMEELGLGPNGGLVYCMEYPFSSIMFSSIVSLHEYPC